VAQISISVGETINTLEPTDQQRLLTRLFGGGSLRHQNPETISSLLQRHLIDDEEKLTVPGLHVFIGAVREQQAAARRRAGDAYPRSISAHPYGAG
jgi:hypothetical protein